MRSWLVDGEQVSIQCRPHARVLVFPIVVGLLLIVACSAALAKLQAGVFASWAPGAESFREPAIVLLVTAVLLIEIAYPVRRILRWINTSYILTNERVVIRRGNLRRQQDDFVLARVQSVDMRQKFRQRLVGAGELDFHMVTGGVRTVHDVPYIQEFKNYTHEAWMNLFRASFQPAPGQGYYAEDVDAIESELVGREPRELGRD